jgi:energy-coupling factor transporter ATP-binding protein EcfA2
MLISTLLLQTKTLKPLMELKGLNGGPDTLLLFKDMDLRLPAGVSALLGDEGSGKTSLLRLLSGDLVAKSGELCVLGVDVPLSAPTPGWVFWTDLRLPLNDEFTPAQCWDAFARNWPEWSEATQKSFGQNFATDTPYGQATEHAVHRQPPQGRLGGSPGLRGQGHFA